MFRAMRRGNGWIAKKSAASLNPSQVETTLVQLSERWPAKAAPLADVVEQFPLGESALLHLLAVSSSCAMRLTQNPETLLWLSQPKVCLAARGYTETLSELHALAGDSVATQDFAALRFWKGREMTRVALRELANVAPLEETTGELSQIAEICIRRVFEHWNAELRRRYGSPKAEFAILALGKLGGGELNHSSDVDLLFLYNDEGELTPHISYHEFFNRLGKRILETFSTPHGAGSLFRVDLRLRPEGSAGPLARSLESMENYYAGFGETWERIALIKARGIAGSRELAYEFSRQHQSFIYPKSTTRDLLDEIAHIKHRIERDIVGTANLTLDNTYRFLRRVEHRLQIEAEQQTHVAPREPEALRRLALSLRFSSSEGFTAALHEKMRAVRPIFERIISKTPAAPAETHAVNDLAIFNEQKRAAKAFIDLEKSAAGFHIAPRTRQIFGKLRPVLIEWLAKSADPDATLNQFVRFVQAYGLRSLLFELLVANPRLLELLVKTFDASRFARELLIRRPQLLEDITRDPAFHQPRSVAENLRRLDSLGADANNLDPIRAYRQRQLLRIILREVLGLASPTTTFADLSDLAEACLHFTVRVLGSEHLTVIALGKFGGHEISYGADLDVLFVGDDTRATQNLMIAMAQPTAEGNIWPLDPRLRPEGEKGPIICSVETYRWYYGNRAQPWELQALTRARAVTGPMQNDFIELAKGVWRQAGQHSDLPARIDNMLERIRRDRGSGSDLLDLKTGRGGIIEAEFFAQALQMRENIWEQNFERAIDRLHRHGHMTDSEVAKLKNAYGLLRRCELVLRRFDNRSVSTLPDDTVEQRKFSIRLGYNEFDAFRHDYINARDAIHALYEHHITAASLP